MVCRLYNAVGKERVFSFCGQQSDKIFRNRVVSTVSSVLEAIKELLIEVLPIINGLFHVIDNFRQ